MDKIARNRETGWIWKIGLSLLAALLLEGFLAVSAARHGQGSQEAVTLWPDRLEAASGYRVEETAGGSRFEPENNDPQLYFAPSGQAFGSLSLTFGEPLEEELQIQIYSSAGGEVYVENRYVTAGSQSAEFHVASRDYGQLRLDLNGSFVLQKIQARPSVPLGEIGVEQAARCVSFPRFAAIWLLAFFGACSPVIQSGIRRLSASARGKGELRQRTVPGAGGARGRLVYLDLLRAMAALFAVAYHVLSMVMLETEPQTARWMVMAAGGLIFLTCNPLFLMISGTLLVKDKEERLLCFWGKRLAKTALPLVLFYLFYMAVFWAGDLDPAALALRAVSTILGGSSRIAPHFWLMYVLLGIYLIVPLLRKTAGRLGQRGEQALFLGIAVLMTAATTLKYFGMGGAQWFNWILWVGIFLSGYLVNRPWMRRYDGGLALLGILTAFLSLRIMAERSDYEGIIFNGSILIVGISWALFAAAVRLDRLLSALSPVLAFLGKHSFSVLLIHWMVLYRVLLPGHVPGLMSHGSAARLAGMFLVTLGISLAVSVVFDELILPGIFRCSGYIFRKNSIK